MAKPKCGTCHYFQEAGLAGSGWCHHPQRKVSSGVMIMVRRNELACRDEWAKSLWTPKQGNVNDEPAFQRPPGLGPATPANVDDLRAAFSTTTPNLEDQISGSGGEDVLLSEGRIVSESHEPPAPREPERSFPTGGFDPRTAVIRAREAYRERTRAREVAARHSAGAEVLSARRDGPELPVADEGPNQPAPDRDRLPAATGLQQPLASLLDPAPKHVGGADLEAAAPAGESGGYDQPAWAEDASLVSMPTDDRLSTEAMHSGEDPFKPFDYPEDEGFKADLRLDRLDEIAEQSLPTWFRTDMPRMCRSCRDYRPAADGERGWCANAWAFTHRRLVREEEIAPCDSAIGDWWVPVDDVWLVAADVSSHGRATPLMDRLTARPADQRRRS